MVKQEEIRISIRTASSSQELSTKVLFLTVKWLRSVAPLQQLNQSDQDSLLDSCWHQLFILTAAQWGFHFDLGETANISGFEL